MDYKYVINLIEINVFISLIKNRKILFLGDYINLFKSLDIITSFERIIKVIFEKEEEEEETNNKILKKDVVIDKE